MKIAITLLYITFSLMAIAQSYQPKKVGKKAVSQFEKAMAKIQEDQLTQAIPFFEKAIEADSRYADAILSLAGVYGELKNYKSAVAYFERGKAIDPQYFRFYNLPYSINLAGLGRFEEALVAINEFLAIPELSDRSRKSGEYRKRTYQFGLDYSRKHPNNDYVFTPVNMGDSINSPRSEYYPSITINDSVFVFTRRGPGFREDFYESNILGNHSYGSSKLIQGDINLEPSKGAINISQDGEWLVFAGYDFRGGFGDFDLYLSYYTPTGWSEPINLGSSINTASWESSPSLSPDKRALYFSSNRPGGYGGKDLYVSYRLANGRWAPAKNMGPEINTAGDELAPFIHADNATLYFTSDGLPGYGNSDIYVCRKGPKGEWSMPENIGFPVNTIENDGSLFVASNGKTAYYASDRSDSRGGLDIYTFELNKRVRPAKTLYVKGTVYDVKTGKGIPSSVELIDNATRNTINNVQTDEKGNYFITLPVGRDYTFTVNRKGYLFYNDLFELSRHEPDSTYKKDIPLQPIELNASIVLKNIHFETNSAALQPVSIIEIDKLYQLLIDNPTLGVSINGHTDNVGNPAANLTLSTNRAKAVVDYLVEKGIKKDRLSYTGFGETKPISSNDTEEGRALNRRTTFVVTAQ